MHPNDRVIAVRDCTLMFLFNLCRCLPLLLFPAIIPSVVIFSKLFSLVMWPKYCNRLSFTKFAIQFFVPVMYPMELEAFISAICVIRLGTFSQCHCHVHPCHRYNPVTCTFMSSLQPCYRSWSPPTVTSEPRKCPTLYTRSVKDWWTMMALKWTLS